MENGIYNSMSHVFIVLTHMEFIFYFFFLGGNLYQPCMLFFPQKKKKKKPCMLVWYCNLNIGRQLIDHLPFLFHYPVDLHTVFLTSLSIHTIVCLNISSIFCHKYVH